MTNSFQLGPARPEPFLFRLIRPWYWPSSAWIAVLAVMIIAAVVTIQSVSGFSTGGNLLWQILQHRLRVLLQ